MNEQQVSVIIPMYNAEITIKRAIQSVQAQTYPLLDIIVIDDGSTDRGVQQVQQMAIDDQRIQLYSQKNKGPSSARNEGLTRATGAFIQFVDADDWIKPTMTAQLVDKLSKQCDLVLCGYETEQQTIRPTYSGIAARSTWLEEIGDLYERTLLPTPCNKLYRRNIIEEHNLSFSHDISIGEDLLFNLDYLKYCRDIAFTEATPYIYCYKAGSLTRKYDPALFPIQKKLHEYFLTFLQEQQIATTKNLTAANRIFLHSTAYAINNVYHEKAPLNTREQYNVIQSILLDDTVQRVALLEFSLFTFFIRKQQIFLMHFFYKLKSFVKQIVRRKR